MWLFGRQFLQVDAGRLRPRSAAISAKGESKASSLTSRVGRLQAQYVDRELGLKTSARCMNKDQSYEGDMWTS